MLDAFSRVVDQADKSGAYLSGDQINALSAMVSESNKRLDTVNRLTGNASAIVANAYRGLVAENRSEKPMQNYAYLSISVYASERAD